MLIVFDLDDTLIDTSGSIAPYKLRMLIDLLSKCGRLSQPAEDAYREILQLDRKMPASRDTIRLTLERYGAEELLSEALKIYSSPLPENFQIRTTPFAKKILLSLSRSHRLAVVTQGREAYQLEKLEKASLEPSIFCKINVVEDCQKKPSYEALSQEFLMGSESCMAVGDRILMDLAPACELGWRTVHMRWGRGRMCQNEEWVGHSIHDLSELLEII